MSHYSEPAASTSHSVSQMMTATFLWVRGTELHLHIYRFTPSGISEFRHCPLGTLSQRCERSSLNVYVTVLWYLYHLLLRRTKHHYDSFN